MTRTSAKKRILYTADLGYVSYVHPEILKASRASAEVFVSSLGQEVVFREMGEADGLLPDLYGAWGIAMGAQERVSRAFRRQFIVILGNDTPSFERRRLAED